MNTSLSLDHYRLLGRSGLRVSPLALGTMTFGADWAGAPNWPRLAVCLTFMSNAAATLSIPPTAIPKAAPNVSWGNSPPGAAIGW